MKAQKTISSILIGLGCIILTIGLVAFFLPRVENYQLQLVLSSFQEPSDNWFVSRFNAGMNFAMDNYLSLLLIGAAVMLLGIVLLMSVKNEEAARARRRHSSPRHSHHDNPYTRPRTEPHSMHYHSETEDNPFARYVNTRAIPKSTGRDADEPMNQTQERPLAQPEPEKAENPFVAHNHQPAKALERSHFRSADDAAAEEDDLFRKPLHPSQSDIRETPYDALEDIDDEPLTVPVSAPASAAAPRPVIRSTFRNATFDQPHSEIVPDTPPTVQEESAVKTSPAPQPGSRIRSTMGRKH